MPAKKFRFVSPGVQIKEIDQSKLPKLPQPVGPVVIGRTLRGPGMVPVTVGSYEEFVQKFGPPDRGAGSTDVWRNGNTTSPTYAAYAAEAWLKNSSPLTVVRLLGTEHPEATVAGGAGWTTDKVSPSSSAAENGGAFGLFVVPADSLSSATGSLAAVIYLDEGSVSLTGKLMGTGSVVSEASALVGNVGSSYEFRLLIKNKTGGVEEDVSVNFDRSSAKYIRKVLNTNPTLTNNAITPAASLKTYWLGETFETFLKDTVDPDLGNVANEVLGFVAPLHNADLGVNMADMTIESRPGVSGWVIGQDLNAPNSSFSPADMPKLFRIVAGESDTGSDWEQNNIKVSIFDIKPSPTEFEKFGTFSVGVRKVDDTDSNPEFLEVFTGCNLDPNSPSYVAAKIGDRFLKWDSSERRHKEIGDYPNISKHIRVEMNPIIEQGGIEPEVLPFGFFGPPRAKAIHIVDSELSGSGFLKLGSDEMPEATVAGKLNTADVAVNDMKLLFPRMELREDADASGALDKTLTFFGVVPTLGTLAKLNEDFRDLARAKPDGLSSDVAGDGTEDSFVFTLDDVIITGSATGGVKVLWEEGARAAGKSYTSLIGNTDIDWLSDPTGATLAVKDHSFVNLVEAGHNRFTMPLFGGFDGLSIKEREPFRNTLTDGKSAINSSPVNSMLRALDSIREPEILDMNLLALPGVTNKAVTKAAIDVCESRADALAIIDLEGGYKPASENASLESERLGNVKDTVSAMKARNLNSSFGCSYYPWVKVLDSESGFPIWMPPSVVALGTMASSQESSALWFAPAGFNRGGLSLGSSGLSVVGVREKLSSKQRDSLYEVNINPIASFPSEGIVIFGQKTLQAVPSALDRINVRRLVLFLKKEISRISARLLFEPNVSATWNKFKGQATPVLEAVKGGFGISEYKLVLDETTTTPEEVDRNMMYAKLFIKPVYAIEFIGIDFIITNTGASFEDL